MISKVNLNNKYLLGRDQVTQDYRMSPQPVYIEVNTGHVCAPAYNGVLYCRHTGHTRTKINYKQYLRMSSLEYKSIAQGRLGRLEYSMYIHLVNDSTRLQLPANP